MTQTITKAITPLAIKQADDDTLTFTGLASTWDLDLGGDIIHHGAFARTLDHWRGSSKIIPLIDQHSYGSVRAVVGKMTDARETDDGLVTTWQVIDTADGREVFERIKGGFVDGLSIGYRPVGEPEMSDDGIRHLKEVALEEVSVVIWPMNPGARVQSVKAALAEMTAEQLAELRALLTVEPPADEAPAPKGLAPDDPARLKVEADARAVLIRSLAMGTDG